MKKTLCLQILGASLLVMGLVTTLLLLGTSPLLAQSGGTGALTGTVTDPTGAVVVNATVLAINVANNQSRTAATDAAGSYKFSLLPPGVYMLRFAAKGFKTAEVPAITIVTTETASSEAQNLQVGATSENIQVTAGGEILQTATSTLGGEIGAETVTSLPLTSRNFTQILGLSAGVAGPVANAASLGRGTTDVSTNGLSTRDTNIELDGVNDNNYARTASANDQAGFSGSNIPEPDAIQEFVVQTSTYDASYGRNPGANINVVTKSGTNQLHGTAFEFIRNSALNAREYFSKSSLLNQNQFGGTVGGPIKKDKLFFFGSYQGTRQTNAITPQASYTPFLPGLTDDRSAAGIATAVDPSSGLEYCQETPGIACDGTGIDGVALKILQIPGYDGMWGKYFFPTGSGPTTFVKPATFTEDQVLDNVDYVISPKHTLSWRMLFSRDPEYAPMTWNGFTLGEPSTTFYRDWNEILRLTSVMSSTFTNEVSISGQRNFAYLGSALPPGSSPADLGITPESGNTLDPPSLIFLSGLGIFNEFAPGGGIQNQFQAADQMAWTHGQHTIRAGFEQEKIISEALNYGGMQRGLELELNLGEFLQGFPFMTPVGDATAASGLFLKTLVNNTFTYVQDDWKFSKRLTLNLGLRWEYFGGPTEKHGDLTMIDPALISSVPTPTGPMTSGVGISQYIVPDNYQATPGRGAPPPGVTMSSTGYTFGNPPKTGFSPRIGFSWQAAPRLVVRGGFGLFNDEVGEDAVSHDTQENAPYALNTSYGVGTGHTLENPFATSAVLGQFASFWSNLTCAPDGTNCTGATSGLSASYGSQMLKIPVTRQYDLDVQYEFAPNWMLQVGYVGASGINQVDEYRDLNDAQLASPSNPINGQIANTRANIPLRVPIVGYQSGGLAATLYDGITNYNSLQITLKKSFSHGLQMQTAYTWSKSLTNLGQSALVPGEFAANTNNPSDLRDQYAPAVWEHPQRLSVYYTYNLPFTNHSGALGEIVNNWSLSGTTIAQDGFPLTLYDGAGGSIYGTGTSVAELCPGAKASQMLAHVSHQQAARTGYFNAAAFCNEPTIGDGTDFGNSPLGAVLSPGNFNWDAALQKNFKITERHTFEFRTEFYNFPNHTQFNSPISANEGQVSISRLPNGNVAPTGQAPLSSTSVNPRLIQFGLKYKF